MENNYVLIKGAYNSHFQYHSEMAQDRFVANILDFKKNGYVVDIGSLNSVNDSNSYFFDRFLDWKSICIDLKVEDDYSSRKNTRFYNEDATKLDYTKIFKENSFPESIDYLSIDIEEAANDVLKILPLKTYKFATITVEHNSCILGEPHRDEQRKILSDAGYHLLCGDVWHTINRTTNINEYAED